MTENNSHESATSSSNLLLELEKYKSAFNEAVDAIIISDGASGKIIDANDSCAALLGYSINEIIGRHYLFLFDNSNPAQSVFSVDKIKMFDSITIKNLKTKNGKIVPVELVTNTFQVFNNNLIMTSFRDASERIEYEKKIKKYALKLKESNTSKDKLFSIIAHDLKNSLSALMNYSEILTEDSIDGDMENIEETSMHIKSISKEVFEMLENLLNWSRMQTGKIELTKSKLNIYLLIEKLRRSFHFYAELKEVEVINSLERGLYLYTSEFIISTLLRNLISNGIKFTPHNGYVKISSSVSKKYVDIIIEDSGIGMSKGLVDKLFKIDYSVSRKGTDNESGTGLGLILCNEFIKKIGGNILVQSQESKGSKFIVRLPIELIN
ncbi:MAG: PAS domain-containing sensor histidine kinase [Ignavibacteria bacterium]